MAPGIWAVLAPSTPFSALVQTIPGFEGFLFFKGRQSVVCVDAGSTFSESESESESAAASGFRLIFTYV
jgi:hypothetical protein